MIGALLLLFICALKGRKAQESRTKCEEYRARRRQLESLCDEEDPSTIDRGISDLRETKLAPHLRQLVEIWMPAIETRLEEARRFRELEWDRLEKIRRREAVTEAVAKMRETAKARIAQSRKAHPVLAARDAAIQRLARVKVRRGQLEADVDEMLEGKSWWTQLSYDYPDYNKMDKEIRDLERDVKLFLSRNAKTIREAEEKLDAAAGASTRGYGGSRKPSLAPFRIGGRKPSTGTPLHGTRLSCRRCRFLSPSGRTSHNPARSMTRCAQSMAISMA